MSRSGRRSPRSPASWASFRSAGRWSIRSWSSPALPNRPRCRSSRRMREPRSVNTSWSRARTCSWSTMIFPSTRGRIGRSRSSFAVRRDARRIRATYSISIRVFLSGARNSRRNRGVGRLPRFRSSRRRRETCRHTSRRTSSRSPTVRSTSKATSSTRVSDPHSTSDSRCRASDPRRRSRR